MKRIITVTTPTIVMSDGHGSPLVQIEGKCLLAAVDTDDFDGDIRDRSRFAESIAQTFMFTRLKVTGRRSAVPRTCTANKQIM